MAGVVVAGLAVAGVVEAGVLEAGVIVYRIASRGYPAGATVWTAVSRRTYKETNTENPCLVPGSQGT